jgi:predicted DNA-binding ribbon-helix-helix protein
MANYKRVNVSLTEAIWQAIKQEAESRNISASTLIKLIFEKYMESKQL